MIALTKEKDNKYDNHCQEDFVWKVGNRAPDPQIENALPPEKKHTHTHAHTQFIMQWSQKGRVMEWCDVKWLCDEKMLWG